jgi:ACR3 family arsenite efflux pump ArsB
LDQATSSNWAIDSQPGAALATVIGVLNEVPVMLSVVRSSRGWYELG